MANSKTTTQTEEVKELVVDARFIMRSRDKKDGDGKVTGQIEYVSFELIDPFGEEDFRDVPLKAKWDKYNDKGYLIRPDRVFGYMSFYAKKALRTNADVRVKVAIKLVRYKSKKTGQMVTYAGIFADPTFVDLADERPVEMVCKMPMDNNTFTLLAGKALGITITGKPDDEDVGL